MIVSSVTDDNKNVSNIHVFRRDSLDERTHEIIEDFHPYFYIHADAQVKEHGGIIDVVSGFTSLNGEPLKKIIMRSTNDLTDLRDKYDRTWESDVLFKNRYMIDTFEGPLPQEPLRIHYFDIETDDENGFPNPEQAEEQVLSIGCYDNAKETYAVLTWDEDNEEVEKVDGDDYTTIIYPNEVEMMVAWVETIEETDPDVLTGWNSTEFDALYLINRLKMLRTQTADTRLEPNRLSPKELGEEHRSAYVNRRGYPEIKGRMLVDLLKAYKGYKYGEEDSYRLDDIAETELGIKKIPMERGFREMWENDFETFIQYNKRDVELTVKLNEELEIIDFWDVVRRICHCDLEQVLITSQQVDNYILDYLTRDDSPDYVLPAKAEGSRAEATGGYVYEATPGVAEEVAVADLSSLYPSCVITANISPETLDDEGQIVVDEEQDIRFSTEKEGLLPQLFGDLFEVRYDYKDKMKEAEDDSQREKVLDSKQRGVKVVMNSIFGVMLNPYFRLFEPDVGRAITKMGRDTLKWSEKIAKEHGFDVVYGDSVPADEPVRVRVYGEETTCEIQALVGIPDDAIEVWTDDGWADVEQVIKKPFRRHSSDMYRVETDEGSTVRVTDDHSLLTPDGEEVPPTDLDEGDTLLARPRDGDDAGSETIESIEKVRYTGDHVFDLQTSNHHFHAGDGNIIVHNTDSIFIDGQGASIKDLNDVIEAINDSYDEFTKTKNIPEDRDHRLILEFEKYYKRVFFTDAKKRYAGLKVWDDEGSTYYLITEKQDGPVAPDQEIPLTDGSTVTPDELEEGDEVENLGTVTAIEQIPVRKIEGGKLDVTGFETVRSDTAEFARDIQEHVLEMIVRGKDKEDILDYVAEKRKAIANGNVDIEEIGMPMGLNKSLNEYSSNGPHVRGTIFSNNYLGTNFGEGDKVKVLYIKDHPPMEHKGNNDAVSLVDSGGRDTRTDVICFQEKHQVPQSFDVDWEKMAEKLIDMKLERIFESMGWSMEELSGQQTLGDVL